MIRPTSAKKHRPTFCGSGITLLKKLTGQPDNSLIRAIAARSTARYNQPAKGLQTKAVMNLARGRTTFLLGGTGFGKSRVAEQPI